MPINYSFIVRSELVQIPLIPYYRIAQKTLHYATRSQITPPTYALLTMCNTIGQMLNETLRLSRCAQINNNNIMFKINDYLLSLLSLTGLSMELKNIVMNYMYIIFKYYSYSILF
jgi:hypothetical protein